MARGRRPAASLRRSRRLPHHQLGRQHHRTRRVDAVNLFDDDVGHHLAAHLHVLIDSGDLRVRLPQHPRAVAGGKKPFCQWISLWRFGLDDG